MDNLDDLTYSSEAFATRFLYFQGLNDINLFVEDMDMGFLYETIFKRMLGNDYTITAITPLGGKPNVIKQFHEFGTQTDGIPNVYIVDGDFDRYIHANDMINSQNFIYLKTYNIENYFLDEDACIQFAKGRLCCFDDIVKSKVDFDNWKTRIVNESAKLFLCYCFVQKVKPELETLSRPIGKFIDCKTGFERTDGAFEQYFNSIKTLSDDIERDISEIDNIYKSINGDDYFNLICGKFLLDSLCFHIRNIVGSPINKEDFKWHLVNHFDITKLNYIKDAIIQIAT